VRTDQFIKLVKDYFINHGRILPWRSEELFEKNPNQVAYEILVSEIMLQQTQVSRVIPKFQEFLSMFPTAEKLADASFQDVLKIWQGLGYNRRALYLHEAVKNLFETRWSYQDLVEQKGIGENTAAAVCAYAYNRPLVFIETNIRAVYLHHFFNNQTDISDKNLLPLIKKTLDVQQPRMWYWALMDYGTYVKKVYQNPSRNSKHHIKQSTFEGSVRQLRAQVLRVLLESPKSLQELRIIKNDSRLKLVLDALEEERLICYSQKKYRIHQ
jgi:A/G-specific adenine glycosylase